MFYLLETVDVGVADEGDCLSVTVGTGRTTDAVDIVFGIVRHVVVDDDADVVDVNATGHDIGSNEDIGNPRLETVHHLVALLLAEVAVHLVAVNVHLFQLTVDLLDLLLFAGEDDDTLQVASLEKMLDDLEFLRLVTDIRTLADFLGGLGNGYLDLYGIVEQRDG